MPNRSISRLKCALRVVMYVYTIVHAKNTCANIPGSDNHPEVVRHHHLPMLLLLRML